MARVPRILKVGKRYLLGGAAEMAHRPDMGRVPGRFADHITTAISQKQDGISEGRRRDTCGCLWTEDISSLDSEAPADQTVALASAARFLVRRK